MSKLLRLIVGSDLTVEGYKALVQLGCVIEEYESYNSIQFPAGTIREEVLPRVVSERYLLHLPNGKTLRETYNRFTEQSVLFLPDRTLQTL